MGIDMSFGVNTQGLLLGAVGLYDLTVGTSAVRKRFLPVLLWVVASESAAAWTTALRGMLAALARAKPEAEPLQAKIQDVFFDRGPLVAPDDKLHPLFSKAIPGRFPDILELRSASLTPNMQCARRRALTSISAHRLPRPWNTDQGHKV